jgi:hypothetical protein
MLNFSSNFFCALIDLRSSLDPEPVRPDAKRKLGQNKNALAAERWTGLSKLLVPKKGLEPPHPCEYMDLNHARLPIPPLRHG